MRIIAILFTLLLFITFTSYSQDIQKRTLQISKTETPPKIDGILDDEAWGTADIATGFTQESPVPGAKPSQRTEVKVVYSNDAIYVSAYMYDESPDSILHQLTERDDEGNSDTFGFWLSPFNDGINAFLFSITPDGVQSDIKVSLYDFDDSWNAVWKSETKKTANGWVAEFEIPFSAIRFPSTKVQTWDVNFSRNIRRHREQSFWQEVNPDADNIIIFSGSLVGIQDIKTPPRLFFYPYASTYYNFSKNEETGKIDGATSFNAGMDVKYGLNDAFTLDVTLIPDFGQVQSDNLILNLSAFETQFNENRQFFNEGTELFNKGRIFYSRRIGGDPINCYELDEGETFESSQEAIQLINASKVSGRNNNGLGIGVLNAVTKESSVIVKDSLGNIREIITSPLTNYNVVVLDQNLKNNSSISLINTSVLREGGTYDATVTATSFTLNNKNSTYALAGDLKYNKKYNFKDGEPDDGFAYGVEFGKTRGNFRFNLRHGVESQYYDPNDLGILQSPNEVVYGGSVNYNIYKPFWNGKFNRMWSGVYTGISTLFEGRKFTDQWLGGYLGMVAKNFVSFGTNINIDPRRNYDYYEPRSENGDRYYKRNKKYNLSAWISSDYRKKIALDSRISINNEFTESRRGLFYRIAPRFRVNDHLSFNYILSHNQIRNGEGYTTVIDNDEEEASDEYKYIFAKRNQETTTNIIEGKYVFNNKMALSLRLRHYWSSVDILHFLVLDDLGELNPTDFDDFNEDGTSDFDQNFNSFNADIVYSWVFAPGSEFNLVWKTAVSEFQTEIPRNFIDDIDHTFNLPKGNSVSIKVLYFVDYNLLRNKFNGSR